MESYISDWLNLIFRWLHLIFGAAWIGTSFYFNWLNHALREPDEPMDGISGQLFSVHGGHFYQVLKYKGAPAKLPKVLHWFKWEAYLTWLTGFGLVMVVYYLNADIYLINRELADLTQWQAIGISLGVLIGGWVAYDLLCKSPLRHHKKVLAVLGLGLITGLAYFLTQTFGSRAAYIHIGAMMGTMMAANVFFVIIPNQRIMVDAMQRGEEPDTTLGDAGALRSLHNNYFTLPVLFIMVSNHFPMTYGHEYNWAILAGIAIIGGVAKHHFNLQDKGKGKVWMLPAAALALLALAFVSRPAPGPSLGKDVSFSQVQGIIEARCQTCHSANPTLPGLQTAPQGVIYDTPEDIRRMAPKIKAMAVDADTMPPGNLTQITPEERAILGAWVSQGAHLD